MLNEKKNVIDFNEWREIQSKEDGEEKQKLQESWLRMFGGFLKTILSKMFGTSDIPVKVRGNRREVKSFANAVKGEKDYMSAFQKYGLNDPKTLNNKHKLNRAIEKFEKETGLTWPFS